MPLVAKPKAIAIALVEFVFLLGLWMLFVCLLHWNEVEAGVVAAAIGAVADAMVKATGFAVFRPRLSHVLLIFRLPAQIISNTVRVFAELFRRMFGGESRASLQLVGFDNGGDEEDAAARRALAICYTTIPANSIVVGIDAEGDFLLLHSLFPEPVSPVTRQLGARP